MRIDDLTIPDTPACRGALEVATRYHTPSLLNHSIRAYLFAAAYGQARSIAFDAELLYVAAMLHDIGLVAEYDSHTVPYEEAGGHVAWAFCAGAGWSPERRERAAEVIIRHMWAEVPVEDDPEGHLLELSTGMDISGRRTDEIPEGVRAEALERHPRLEIAKEFSACIADQGARKPSSFAGGFVRDGIVDRIARNPLDA
ncbi:HD domain-containing protein [Nonomuraea sp. KC401]|uniref:HD domain-containing protein n=1 Tax=unclassified Nonomuraea TaxID=2593643 RepID=UPI0010FD4BE4|nr:HD domain-containing protein [Nonomuraea sp. KC401]NBE96094.1 HD domain-containing protein [Nonomuraea sp. K271]TLF80292.1 HD domain-containing protein [Nonomuraea sp. KC401]